VTTRHPPSAADRFDASYYDRYYGGGRGVHSAREVALLASGVYGLARWLGVEIASVLDVGAGVGLWRRWFRRHHPRVAYRSIEVSAHAARRWGHERRDISRWCARERFDLVVCHGVLPYLDDDAAARAIENLGRMCRGVLYLEAITRRDLERVVDREATDTAVHARSGAWYRRHLARHFAQVGGGLWVSRRSGVALYELEAPPAGRRG
jgi:2-polyprenyl-3-methyl-5-hydroxy-6-metoxy-1,4-benzoquinol methylase